MSRPSDTRAKIHATFARLSAVPREALGGVLEGYLDDTADRVRSNAPSDEGELREGVGIIAPEPGKSPVIRGSVVVTSDHAAAVEYGTVHAAPQPYFRPAIRGGQARLRALILSAISRRLRR